MPYGSVLHIPPTNHNLLAVKREAYQKAYLLTKNTEAFYGTVGRQKDKTEKATGKDEQARR